MIARLFSINGERAPRVDTAFEGKGRKVPRASIRRIAKALISFCAERFFDCIFVCAGESRMAAKEGRELGKSMEEEVVRPPLRNVVVF